MKYFLPDSQDLVDPTFDFHSESRSRSRIRHRDDLYAHEIFATRPFDGILVSKGIVDGVNNAGRYTLSQRERLLRAGARDFLRATFADGTRIPVMGDCGAFTYAEEKVPPYSVDELIAFYSDCGFDYGLSLDHVIVDFDPSLDRKRRVPAELTRRQQLTEQLAADFWRRCAKRSVGFQPIGVAQGWSPDSYARSVATLQRIGYRYVAIGGLVPLKTAEIILALERISSVRESRTKLHLLGVTRLEQWKRFAGFGVVSFDSTSPLRQAFKDDRDNYYTLDRTYVAIRIPQIDGNPSLQRRISAGRVSQSKAMMLERAAMTAISERARGRCSIDRVLSAILEYEHLFQEGRRQRDRAADYRETLEAEPWRHCECEICRELGHHVILFRGAERNRRRGFHNVWTFFRRLQRDIASARTTRLSKLAEGDTRP